MRALRGAPPESIPLPRGGEVPPKVGPLSNGTASDTVVCLSLDNFQFFFFFRIQTRFGDAETLREEFVKYGRGYYGGNTIRLTKVLAGKLEAKLFFHNGRL